MIRALLHFSPLNRWIFFLFLFEDKKWVGILQSWFFFHFLFNSLSIKNGRESRKNEKLEIFECGREAEKQFAEQSGTWFFRLLFPKETSLYWLEFFPAPPKTWDLSNYLLNEKKEKEKSFKRNCLRSSCISSHLFLTSEFMFTKWAPI